MTVRNLDALFQPRSVAVVGASNRPRSVGAVVMRNLLQAGFEGPIMPVNPKHRAVAGVLAYPRVEELPVAPDLAVICTPPRVVPDIVAALGDRGTRAAAVLTAGLSRFQDAAGRPLDRALLENARPHLLRILGPNCVGLLVPGIGLNASFAHTPALPGNLAFVSQSGALCTAILDWAAARGIGFSHFVSLGNSDDVDFGDVLDYLGADPRTGAILLYIEAIVHARKFLSAARAAARNKPVVAVKAGRVEEGARAAASHTGALAGADDVYDAALQRAGVLRVLEVDELFDAVETLARARPIQGERLAILTNGGGPGVMATDSLVALGGELAQLGDATVKTLDGMLPDTWSRGNPVDIIGDAPPERYEQAAGVVLADPGVDALLVLNAPTAIASTEEVAARVIEGAQGAAKTVLTCWLGRESSPSREAFAAAGIPTYLTPGHAVRAFLHLVHHRRNQQMLMECPPSLPGGKAPDRERIQALLDGALGEGREFLTEPESKEVLAAYGVPIVETRTAADAREAAEQARELGFPVALKLLSPDVTHKSDVGGVALDLPDAEAVQRAAARIEERLRELRPEARRQGYTVQKMVRRPRAQELLAGLATDPIFGPVIVFGQGGTAVEVIRDRALALPPLNAVLARDAVSRTRVARLLGGYRDRPPADLDAVYSVLMRLSQIAVDVPEIVELDVNPLLADDEGVVALDARVRVARVPHGVPRLAIRPYPKKLEEWQALDSGDRVFLRPIRPEDEPAHLEFFQHLKPEDIRFRFFGLVRKMAHTQLARYTQIDYDREMAFIATRSEDVPSAETLGEARAIANPDNTQAEFAIVVRSDVKGKGLGKLLLSKLIRYCKERGTGELVGVVLPDNQAMLGLARRLGFQSRHVPEHNEVRVTLEL